MTSKIIAFILGVAVGAAVCAAVFNKKSQPATQTAAMAASETVSSNEIAELKSQLLSAKAQLEKANAVNDKLAASVQDTLKEKNAALATVEKPKKKTGFAALFGGDGTNDMSEAMSKMMKSVMEQQVEGKVSAMKAKLNLTPEQEASIRGILTNEMSRGVEMAQKMFSGEGVQTNDLAQIGKSKLSEDEQIKALLTPDQVTAYAAYKDEEKRTNARLVANSELLQMQSSLQLDEQQQDKVYEVLFNQAQNQLDPTNDFGAANSGSVSPADVIRKQAAQKTEALRAVLTPDQLERYQKFQDQQLKMIEAFMPGASTNAGVDAHVTTIVSP